MANTIIEALYKYLNDCPLMENNRINVNYLPEDTCTTDIEYSIDKRPTDELIRTYLDGSKKCRYLFIISSKQGYAPEISQNLDNAGLLEQIADWLSSQARLRNLPILPDGMSAESIRAIDSSYLFDVDVGMGIYEIQCEMIYNKEGVR